MPERKPDPPQCRLASFLALRGRPIAATDEEFGTVDDVLFDDRTFAVRHLVVDTGGWFSGRRVLVPETLLSSVEASRDAIPVPLSTEEVRDSPGIGSDPPRSHQEAMVYMDFYWLNMPWGGYVGHPVQGLDTPPSDEGAGESNRDTEGDRDAHHLRSAREVIGYRVQALDGELGHVEDLLVDTREWRLPSFALDTRNWLPGEKLVVETDLVSEVRLTERLVVVNAARDSLRERPPYVVEDGAVEIAAP